MIGVDSELTTSHCSMELTPFIKNSDGRRNRTSIAVIFCLFTEVWNYIILTTENYEKERWWECEGIQPGIKLVWLLPRCKYSQTCVDELYCFGIKTSGFIYIYRANSTSDRDLSVFATVIQGGYVGRTDETSVDGSLEAFQGSPTWVLWSCWSV